MIYFPAPRPWLCLKQAASNWPLIIPALAAFGLYYPINTETRFIGEFVLLLWLAAFSGARPGIMGVTEVDRARDCRRRRDQWYLGWMVRLPQFDGFQVRGACVLAGGKLSG